MIKWITKELGVAKRSDVKNGIYEIVDVRDMVDKKGNPKALILDKINAAIGIIKKKRKVVICCDYGLSRSNAITIGVLVKYYGYNFENAVNFLVLKTGKKAMQLGVLNSVRDALNFREIRTKNKKAILIIGENDFIGKNLISFLKNKYKLVVPAKSDIILAKSPIDLDFIVKKNNVGLIIHLVDPGEHTTNQTMGKMIVELKNVLDVCKENKTAFLYLSSGAVFAGYRKTIKASEDLLLCPRDTYGEAKMLCENLLDHCKNNYGLNVCLLRLSRVYGAGSSRAKFIQSFFEKAKNNMPIYTHKYKNGPPILDLLYIEDAITAIEKVIQKKFYGTLHIGSGKGISTFEIAQRIKKICNSESKIHFQKINDYNGNIVMNIGKAKKALGWSPKTDINKGLAEFVNKL